MRLLAPLLLLLAGQARAYRAWTLDALSSPVEQPRACGRDAASHVCDPDGILGEAGAAEIDEALAALEKKEVRWPPGSRCAGVEGVEGAVVVLGRLDTWHHRSVDAAAEFVARGAHDAWGVGSRRCSNGFLLLIAVDDRAFYLSTGDGLRRGGLLGDGRAKRALDASRPGLRAGDAAAGVLSALGEVEYFLDKGPPTYGEWLGEVWPLFLFGGVFAWVIYASCAQRARELRVQREHAAAARALSEAERVRDEPSFQAASCPVCLEDFGADRAPKHLRCGHAFCAPCLDQWAATAAAPGCPVCRAPIARAETSVRAPRRDEEVRFRLASVHRRYPSVLDRRAYDALVRGGYRGSFRSSGGAGGRW